MAPPLSSLYTLSFLLALLTTLLVSASLRLLAILPPTRTPPRRRKSTSVRLLVVLGSGGHTSEMLSLLRDLDPRKYTQRTYIVSSGDAFSAARAAEFERALEERVRGGDADAEKKAHVGPECYAIATLPRARRIHQSLLTTPFSALRTLVYAFRPLVAQRDGGVGAEVQDLPDLIVTNGPATAVIVVLASFILRFFDIRGAQSRGKCKTIYVESFARVKTLSLSGKLLLRVVDRFLVQWQELEGKGGRAEYCGMLV
ncbi:oligosaccharide biosynthesis protein Alg14 like protein [Corynespora cassiicola Philippines]|uniref:UDP-N-acetylglucosamine transferase subunit ALG14 n=1 Tax=Corynespora cassiicola Philippines TaxID=1448308 RepID=A0A2T2NTU9_CORCC|nr:oligosaccharide biosynthesis protein Alg14 like protein [Corynespora cassiicola Philippines]